MGEQYPDSSYNNINTDWDFTKENSEIDKKAYAGEEAQAVQADELNPLPENADMGIENAGIAEAPKSDLNPTPSDTSPELNADLAGYQDSETAGQTEPTVRPGLRRDRSKFGERNLDNNPHDIPEGWKDDVPVGNPDADW